ncbi:hypothetical protein BJY01DRAFT_223650 [Aspergillus pseudoustus]|uniref:Fungal-specific transcription factor domain-containing protein n=1 Tax=Aspergillus pseudoustus TaxID=1810923 RepID=A0ABR4J696_9EURO
MALQFIEEGPSGIGESNRHVIRSHVMRGKNKGRPRRSTKRPKRIEVKEPLTAPSFASKIPRPVLWGDLCLTSFPKELDLESMNLMHRWFFDISDALFPPQFCNKFDIIQSIWVNYILADEAYFHSTLAISASYVDFVRRKAFLSPRTLHHISQAYSLVNAKISGPSCVSDSAIAAVVSLAIYQQVHQEPVIGLVHLQGLYRMISMRGGISLLMQENRALALKPLRLDLELAIQNGTPTLFRSEELPVLPVHCGTNASTGQLSIAAPWLPDTITDLLSFSSLLNQAAGGLISKLDALDYIETLTSLLYRVLETTNLVEASPTTGEMYRHLTQLAMLAFMTTLLPEYTRGGYSCSLLANRIAIALNGSRTVPPVLSDGRSSLLLWILMISAISVLNSTDHPWLRSLIADTSMSLELDDWLAARNQLCQFPWIFALHDAPARRLWEDMTIMRHEKHYTAKDG